MCGKTGGGGRLNILRVGDGIDSLANYTRGVSVGVVLLCRCWSTGHSCSRANPPFCMSNNCDCGPEQSCNTIDTTACCLLHMTTYHLPQGDWAEGADDGGRVFGEDQ